jgi:hypothetical protein
LKWTHTLGVDRYRPGAVAGAARHPRVVWVRSVPDLENELNEGAIGRLPELARSQVHRRARVEGVESAPLGLGLIPALVAAHAGPGLTTALEPRPLELDVGIGSVTG